MSVRHASVEGTAGEDLWEWAIRVVSPGGTAWDLRDEDSTGSARETEVTPAVEHKGSRAVADTMQRMVALAVCMRSVSPLHLKMLCMVAS